MEVPQPNPSHGVSADWRCPIRVARYSYDALDNLSAWNSTARIFSSSIGVFLWLSTLHYRRTLLSWERTSSVPSWLGYSLPR